jgi:hypothetical protein
MDIIRDHSNEDIDLVGKWVTRSFFALLCIALVFPLLEAVTA